MPTPPLESIRLVVLDLDGTLVDAFEDIYRATSHVLAQMKRPPLDFPTVKSYVGNGVEMLMRRTLRSDDPALVGRAAAIWKAYSAEHAGECARLYPGAQALLAGLRSLGVKSAVLSNKVHDLTVEIIDRLCGPAQLDAVWGERPEFACKPDPGALKALMAHLNVRPAETLVVGDGAPDIEAAKAAGAWSCGATWGLNPPDCLAELGADMLVDSLGQLQAAFEEAARQKP